MSSWISIRGSSNSFQNVSANCLSPLAPRIGAADAGDQSRGDILEVRGKKSNHAIDVAAVERLIAASDDLDVLLRNTRSPHRVSTISSVDVTAKSAVMRSPATSPVGYPPFCDVGADQRLEFQEALLDADAFEDLPGKWQAAIAGRSRSPSSGSSTPRPERAPQGYGPVTPSPRSRPMP
jgi:hypothetical protein